MLMNFAHPQLCSQLFRSVFKSPCRPRAKHIRPCRCGRNVVSLQVTFTARQISHVKKTDSSEKKSGKYRIGVRISIVQQRDSAFGERRRLVERMTPVVTSITLNFANVRNEHQLD